MKKGVLSHRTSLALRLWALVFCLSPFGLFAQVEQEEEAPRRSAQCEFDRLSWDFGEIVCAQEAVASFNVVNKGGAPLVIENVTTSCGCTLAKWNEEPIMPGDTVQLQVSYNSNIVGEIKRSVVVKTNDKQRRRTLLTLTGNVIAKEEE